MAIATPSTGQESFEVGYGGDDLRLVDPDVRRALARELHDRVAQTLAAILIDLEVFKTEQTGRNSVQTRVDSVQGSMRDVLSSLRDLLQELRGEAAGAGGDFRGSMVALVSDFERRTGIPATVVFHPSWPRATRPGATMNLYRIAQEALQNVARHSGAKRVSVKLRSLAGGNLSMTVADYGRGFDREATSAGMGTVGMRERAVLIGAELWIDTFPGYGTSVHVTFPRSVLAAD